MIEDKSKILAERLLQIEGPGYDDKFRLYTEAIREHDKATREAVEKEIKRTTGVIEDRNVGLLDKGDESLPRIAPESILRAVEREFDSEEIGED